jgi:hypothetical protein
MKGMGIGYPPPFNDKGDRIPIAEKFSNGFGKTVTLLLREGFLTPRKVEYVTWIKCWGDSKRYPIRS